MTDEEKAAADKAAADKAAADKAPKFTKARVISDHGEHRVDDVVKLAAEDLKAAVAGGWADPHPSAVAHAEGLAKQG
jgi:membrane protein involved in colicin uptake